MSRNKKLIILFLIIFFIISIFSFLFLFSKYRKVFVQVTETKVSSQISPSPTPTPDPNRSFSFLLLAYGGGVHDGGTLTDSIIVSQVIPKEKIIKLIFIPRDLWVPIPISIGESKMAKINEAYSIGLSDKKYPNKEIQYTGSAGGGQLAKDVVSTVVGFPLDNFVVLNFDSFIKIVDTLGGVKINVAKTFDDFYYPIEEKSKDLCDKTPEEITALTATVSGEKLDHYFLCRYEHLHFDKGIQNMDSATLLKFVRSRHSKEDGGDFNRSLRQKLAIEAIKDKLLSLSVLPKILPLFNSLSNNFVTDLSLNKINDLLSKIDEYRDYQIESFQLTDQNYLLNSKSSSGQYILIPKKGDNDWSEIHSFLSKEVTSSSMLN